MFNGTSVQNRQTALSCLGQLHSLIIGEQQHSIQGCMWSSWRGLDQSCWAFLQADSLGHLSVANWHRQRLGTFYACPMFSLSSDNVLLTLGFSCKKSLCHWWIYFSVSGENELFLLAPANADQQHGWISLREDKTREGNIMLTRATRPRWKTYVK